MGYAPWVAELNEDRRLPSGVLGPFQREARGLFAFIVWCHCGYRTDKASSLDDAERKSILAATAKLRQSVQSIAAGLRERLNLGLGDDFRLEKYHSNGMKPSIIDLQSRGSQWHLTVQGVWKEIVTLDSNFRLISHVPAPGEKAKYWTNPPQHPQLQQECKPWL